MEVQFEMKAESAAYGESPTNFVVKAEDADYENGGHRQPTCMDTSAPINVNSSVGMDALAASSYSAAINLGSSAATLKFEEQHGQTEFGFVDVGEAADVSQLHSNEGNADLKPEVEMIDEESRSSCSLVSVTPTDDALDPGPRSRTPANAKPWMCDRCSQRFPLCSLLIAHERSHLTTPSNSDAHGCNHDGVSSYACRVCGATFCDRERLAAHRTIHTGERRHPCDVCGSRFAHNYSLVAHKRTHTGVRPFECLICGARFVENCDLTKHKRIHTGERPYSCDVCADTFAYKSTLHRHKEKKHVVVAVS